MARLGQICKYLKKLAPLEYAGKWDNVGLLVEPTIYSHKTETGQKIEKILLTNDLTLGVLTEAINKKVNMIISYHPPIFGKGFLRMTQDNVKEKIILKCIESKIAVYSPHTAFDCARGGVNDWLIDGCLEGLVDQTEGLHPVEHPPVEKSGPNFPENIGAGRICNKINNTTKLLPDVKIKNIIENVKRLTNLKEISYSAAELDNLDSNNIHTERRINSLAVCAGSGSSVLRNLAGKIDLIVTGEMSHHEILNFTENGTAVILTCHSNSERGFLKHLQVKMAGEFSEVEIFCSGADRDPQIIV